MNKPKTFTDRLQNHIAASAAAALNRNRPQREIHTPFNRLTTLPDHALFAWAPIAVRPQARAARDTRWIE
jgi:hypothetical protein